MSLTISIDAMGGDFGTQVTIPASLDCLKSNPDLTLILVGDEAIIKQLLLQQPKRHQDRLIIHQLHDAVRAEQPHEVVLQRDEKVG